MMGFKKQIIAFYKTLSLLKRKKSPLENLYENFESISPNLQAISNQDVFIAKELKDEFKKTALHFIKLKEKEKKIEKLERRIKKNKTWA